MTTAPRLSLILPICLSLVVIFASAADPFPVRLMSQTNAAAPAPAPTTATAPVTVPTTAPAPAPTIAPAPVTAPVPEPSSHNSHDQTNPSAADPSHNFLNKACGYTKVHYNYCLAALSSNPNSTTAADLQGVAAIALDVASKNATATSAFIGTVNEKVHNRGGRAELDDCVELCQKEYENVVEQLDDSKTALESKNYKQVIEWVSASLSGVKSCQDGCRSAGRMKRVLTKRNKHVSVLCSITLTFARLLH